MNKKLNFEFGKKFLIFKLQWVFVNIGFENDGCSLECN